MTSSFTTGMAHMQGAIEEGKKRAEAARSGGSGSNLSYINWKPGDKKVLRFLTDDVMTEEFAEFIIDNTGKTKNFMIPPNDPHIIDRFKSPTPGIGWRKNPKTGVIEDVKLRKVGVGIAVLRKEDPDLQDFLHEQEVDGTKYLSRHFGIVQQSVSNFWHTLAVSCFKRYGTIIDRDYEITREGDGLNTKYSIIPLDVDPDLDTIEKVQSFYYYGKEKWNNEDPDRFLKCPQTLIEWAEYFASEERFKYWLSPDPAKPATKAPTYSAAEAGTNPLTQPQTLLAPDDTPGPSETQAAAAPTGQPASTNFSSFSQQLLNKAKAQGQAAQD
jgi:hypothetical protein